MVEVSSPSSSFNRLNTPTNRGNVTSRKPVWLYAVYALFLLVCLNAFKTYQEQKELVRLQIEEQGDQAEVHSAGAEEHVVTTGVGSSQYGGSMKAAQSGGKKKKRSDGITYKNIRPEPSDGTNDYATRHSSSDFEGFSFYVMADTPFTDLEEERLGSQMAKLGEYTKNNPGRNISFGFHLGGTQNVSECAESTYESHAALISKGPRPTFVIPGIADWFDCPRQEEAFDSFMKYLGPDLLSGWPGYPFENLDMRRSTENPELFSLYVEGILFLGLHIIDTRPPNQESTSLREERIKASMKWFAESIETNFVEREIRAVVILGHAGRSERNENFFSHMRKYFDKSSSRQNLPVLYLHGNGGSWKIDKDLSPFYDVQVDQGGLAEPCIIDVAPQRNGKVQNLHRGRNKMDAQTILGKGFFRLDQQGGRYSDA
eukprot:CAMPEP_0197176616 /NCGR_PEP_ID=MMETSP1423-20130617/2479_1 /TAXON_ID=476441 /ORGANISM="Pseudo-nitzschia heimii, Strain UNC1101" /LENGTH=428 /DNA_ID=CAMNT_0042626013 /DNA_START=115 /DNA_END=1401 /DNA_ORIENTATION=-